MLAEHECRIVGGGDSWRGEVRRYFGISRVAFEVLYSGPALATQALAAEDARRWADANVGLGRYMGPITSGMGDPRGTHSLDRR